MVQNAAKEKQEKGDVREKEQEKKLETTSHLKFDTAASECAEDDLEPEKKASKAAVGSKKEERLSSFQIYDFHLANASYPYF